MESTRWITSVAWQPPPIKNAHIDFERTQYVNVVGPKGLAAVPVGETRLENVPEISIRLSDVPAQLDNKNQTHVAKLLTARQPRLTQGGFLAGVFNLHPETTQAHGSAAYQSRYAEGQTFWNALPTVIEAVLETGAIMSTFGIGSAIASAAATHKTQVILRKEHIASIAVHLQKQKGVLIALNREKAAPTLKKLEDKMHALKQQIGVLDQKINASEFVAKGMNAAFNEILYGPDGFPVNGHQQEMMGKMRQASHDTIGDYRTQRAALSRKVTNTQKLMDRVNRWINTNTP